MKKVTKRLLVAVVAALAVGACASPLAAQGNKKGGAQLDARMDSLELQLVVLQADVTTLQGDVTALLAQDSVQSAALAQLQADMTTTLQLLADLTTTVNDLATSTAAALQALAASVAQLQTDLADLDGRTDASLQALATALLALEVRVAALEGGSVPPPADSTAPSAPASLSGLVDTTTISLTWGMATDPESGVAAYRIIRNGVEVDAVPEPVLNYVDTGLTPSTDYTYSIVAENGEGLLGPPATVALRTDDRPVPPDPDDGVQILATTPDSVWVEVTYDDVMYDHVRVRWADNDNACRDQCPSPDDTDGRIGHPWTAPSPIVGSIARQDADRSIAFTNWNEETASADTVGVAFVPALPPPGPSIAVLPAGGDWKAAVDSISGEVYTMTVSDTAFAGFATIDSTGARLPGIDSTLVFYAVYTDPAGQWFCDNGTWKEAGFSADSAWVAGPATNGACHIDWDMSRDAGTFAEGIMGVTAEAERFPITPGDLNAVRSLFSWATVRRDPLWAGGGG